MRSLLLSAIALLSVWGSSSDLSAATLQVAPVSIDVTSQNQAAAVQLRNDSDRPVNVQVRVFEWSQKNGKDILTPSRDVVASPPFATLKDGTTYTIRVVRTAPPVRKGEVAYRLLIDQLPEVNVRRPANAVDLVIRYSIPVFFGDRSAAADVQWNVRRDGNRVVLKATNNGNRHAKIADLAVTSAGRRTSLGEGLNGYVLPGESREWTASARSGIKNGSRVTITAGGDDYAVNETAVVGGR